MRRAVGSLALGAVELAILAVAGLAVWRLAEGLVTAQYVGLPFVVNVAGLAILLLLIGGSFQVLCFPSREPLVRRAIEQAVGDLWRTTVRAGREDLRSLVAANESLRAKGETITLAIQQAIKDGLSVTEAGELIAGWSGFDSYRAERIARTELMFAYNAAALDSYGEMGVTEVEAIDGDEDDECADRNGRTFTLEEAEAIEDHPNGTLDWAPVI